LSRLFDKHIGASPIQTAKTARMRRAKRLLNQGGLKMAEIAVLSGFSSVRRFNTVFRELYGRSPKEVLKHAPAD